MPKFLDDIIASGGSKVGIGTASPIDALNLYDADDNVGIYIQTATSGTGGGDGFRLGLNNTHAFVWNYENTPLSFATNGAQKATILANGNFGIGLTNPNNKLMVSGDISLVNNSNSYKFGSTGGDGTWGAPKMTRIGNSIVISDYSGVKLGGYDGTEYNARMTVLGTGNVGIGTQSPDSLLEIESSPAQQTQTRMFHVDNNPTNNQGSGYIEISSGTSSQAKTQIETVSSGGYGLLGNNYLDTAIINRGLSSGAYGNIVFATGSNTSATSIVMTIGGGSQKGRVGIGTASPSNKLHVNVSSSSDSFLLTLNGNNKAIINGSGNGIFFGSLTSYGNTLGGGGGTFNYRGGMNTATVGHRFMHVNGTNFLGSSGIQTMLSVEPLINQSSSAGYTGIKLNVTETATGSGTKNLLDLQVGGTSKTTISSAGNATFAGTIGSGAITSTGKITGTEIEGTSLDINGNADIAGNVEVNEMLTIDITDISTGENRGLQLLNSSGTDQQWNVTAGQTNVDNDKFVIRDATHNINALTLAINSGNAIFAGNLTTPAIDTRILENDEGGNKNRLLFPGGASFNGPGNSTGAIKIKLPVTWTNTMMKIKVRVFDYAQNESFDVNLAGYNYTGGGGSWYNTSAWIDSQADLDRNFTVRFGYENSCCVIYIGELNSAWAYLKVNVVDVMLNHSGTTGAWATGTWAITLETSTFAAVTQSRTNTQVNSWKRNGTSLYSGGGTANVGIGATSPSQKLHVDGNVLISAEKYYYVAGTGGGLGSDSSGNIILRNNSANLMTASGSNAKFAAHGSFATTQNPIAHIQAGSYTFGGGNGVHNNDRLGIMNNGSLTSIVNASTYNDGTYPDYGLVFIQGPSTSSYNVWSISPDGPAKGSDLNFIYQAQATNIHTQTPMLKLHGSTGNATFTGDVAISGETTFKPKHYAATDDLNSDTRTIFSTHSTNASTSNRPINYSTIYTLGGSGVNTLQISTNEDYSESGMWIRQYNANNSSPQGVGYQNWTEVFTTNKVIPSANLDSDTAHLTTTQTFSGAKTFSSSSGVRLFNGSNGTTSKLTFVNTDNNDTSKFIRGNAYYLEFGSNQNEGFKFTDVQNSTTLLQINGGNNSSGSGTNSATFNGKVVAASLDINGVSQHHENKYTAPNYYVSFNRTSSSDQYFKIITNSGSPKRIRLNITSNGDNTNTLDTYFISQSGYNMQTHIHRLPGSKYNTSKLVSVICTNSTGSTQEVWIKLLGMSSGTGTTTVTANVPISTSSAILGTATSTKPTLQSGDSELDISVSDRNSFTTMSSGGAKFGGEVEAASLDISGNVDIDGVTNLDNTDIDGTFNATGTTFDVNASSTLTIDNTNTTNGVAINTATSGGKVTIGHSTSEVLIADNLTIDGNLTTKGDVIIENTTNLAIRDTIITLNDGASGTSGTDSSDIGIMMERHGTNKFFGYDESADEFIMVESTADVSGAVSGVQMGTTQTLHANIRAYDSIKIGETANDAVSVFPASTGTSLGTSNVLVPTQNAVKVYADTKAADNAVVKLTGTQTVGGVKTFSGATSIGSTLASNEYSLVTIQGRKSHMFKFDGQSNHTLTLASGSYYQAEVTITAHQTNGGAYNNMFIRGIWSNNHTAHHWDELERVGSMTGNTIVITNGQSGSTAASGELEIVHANQQGNSFACLTVNVIEHYGSSTHTIS